VRVDELWKWEELTFSWFEALSQFGEIIGYESFAKYQKEFAHKMTSSLSKDFLKGSKETKLAHTIENLVNSVHDHHERGKGPGGSWFELVTKSIFIHGNKSHVQFDFYGITSEPVELGDIIFMCSVIFRGKKYFEKLTITQLKMQRRKKGPIAWRIDNEKQLFLLSRFPQFSVIRGIIPKKTYNLQNISACLGSYGLLFRPGDFTLVSATMLDAILGQGKTVTQSKLTSHYWGLQKGSSLCYPVFDDCLFSPNVYIFADRFLKLNIGELVFSSLGIYNRQGRVFVKDLFGELRRRMLKTREPKLTEFMRHLESFPYADENDVGRDNDNPDIEANDGGIGIVHTTINLGE
jgi:hypothetical protein